MRGKPCTRRGRPRIARPHAKPRAFASSGLRMRHAARFSHIAECSKKHVGGGVFDGRRKIFGYDLVVIELVDHIKGGVGCFHGYGRAIRRFTHSFTAGSCCAEKSASVMMRS